MPNVYRTIQAGVEFADAILVSRVTVICVSRWLVMNTPTAVQMLDVSSEIRVDTNASAIPDLSVTDTSVQHRPVTFLMTAVSMLYASQILSLVSIAVGVKMVMLVMVTNVLRMVRL